MLKTLLATTAIGGLMISGALAQSPSPSAPSASPTPPAQTGTTNKSDSDNASTNQRDSAAATQAPKFIASQGSDQLVMSKFKGTDVLGADEKHIGDVSDVLFTKDGQVKAYIVGVGGFLGIGEKNVAIDPSAFQPVADSDSNDPNNMKLKVTWTKEQLQSAPAFEYYKAPARTTSTGAGGAANTGMSPRPTAPAR